MPIKLTAGLDLKLKGDRHYVHGTDIFNAVAATFGRSGNGYVGRLAFNVIARRMCRLTTCQPAGNTFVARGYWLNDGTEQSDFWIVEYGEPVSERYHYDEDRIASAASVSSRVIRIARNNEYSIIENAVAVTKKLNYALHPRIDGKWLFGQIDLIRAFPPQWETLSVTCIKSRVNAFSQNSLSIDGSLYGEIRFIVGKP